MILYRQRRIFRGKRNPDKNPIPKPPLVYTQYDIYNLNLYLYQLFILQTLAHKMSPYHAHLGKWLWMFLERGISRNIWYMVGLGAIRAFDNPLIWRTWNIRQNRSKLDMQNHRSQIITVFETVFIDRIKLTDYIFIWRFRSCLRKKKSSISEPHYFLFCREQMKEAILNIFLRCFLRVFKLILGRDRLRIVWTLQNKSHTRPMRDIPETKRVL